NGQYEMCRVKTQGRIIIHYATAHAKQANPHHPKSQHQERGRHQPEMHLAPKLAHAATGRFGIPVIDRCKEREDETTEDRIVEMPDNEICIMQMQVKGDGSVWRSSKTAQQEDDDRAEH